MSLPNLPPLEMARSLSGADLVVTSSLHGLVFADAYGVPGQLVTMTDGPHQKQEPTFKYDDYGSALDVTSAAVPLSSVLGAPDPARWIDGLAERTAAVAAGLDAVLEAIYGQRALQSERLLRSRFSNT